MKVFQDGGFIHQFSSNKQPQYNAGSVKETEAGYNSI